MAAGGAETLIRKALGAELALGLVLPAQAGNKTPDLAGFADALRQQAEAKKAK